jgi:peroxiredoxin
MNKILIAGIMIALTATVVSRAEQTGDTDMTTAGSSLKSQLDGKRDAFNEQAPEGVKKSYEEGVQAVDESGVVSQAKQVGDMAPEFSLTNAAGETIRLSDYLKEGPVVLTWYRGGWCPYCNLTLRALQLELPTFKALGANLIALTPELPDQSLSTAEKHDLAFEVLSDIDNNVARAYGIVYQLTDDVAAIYADKFDLSAYNGNDANELPLAATYVINEQGEIIYAFLDADYRNRAEPAAISAALQK